ncbi:MAG: transposase [Acidimicrobiia bacterium]|nr:transposase [Acidimicrobiia bacterium]
MSTSTARTSSTLLLVMRRHGVPQSFRAWPRLCLTSGSYPCSIPDVAGQLTPSLVSCWNPPPGVGLLPTAGAAEGDGVRVDEVISFTAHARQERDVYCRRITFGDADDEREFVFLTNHLALPAATIAELYRQRWQIEQFFRLLKQNLRVKTFVGTSANALKIQIWTALIALLLENQGQRAT